MGCFNMMCVATGTTIMYGDQVYAVPLLLREDKRGTGVYIADDVELVGLPIAGIYDDYGWLEQINERFFEEIPDLFKQDLRLVVVQIAVTCAFHPVLFLRFRQIFKRFLAVGSRVRFSSADYQRRSALHAVGIDSCILHLIIRGTDTADNPGSPAVLCCDASRRVSPGAASRETSPLPSCFPHP